MRIKRRTSLSRAQTGARRDKTSRGAFKRSGGRQINSSLSSRRWWSFTRGGRWMGSCAPRSLTHELLANARRATTGTRRSRRDRATLPVCTRAISHHKHNGGEANIRLLLQTTENSRGRKVASALFTHYTDGNKHQAERHDPEPRVKVASIRKRPLDHRISSS